VGVSLSRGSLWFIDAGRVSFIDRPISARHLSQDDRIEIADGLARGEPVKQIAARIGKSYQSVYREIARNRKPDGRYQPWYAHNPAYQRRRRPKPRRRRRAADRQVGLRHTVRDDLPHRAGDVGDATPPVDPRLPLAVAAYLARFTGLSRQHTASDLRAYLA
jgi:Helix-turn-helix domain